MYPAEIENQLLASPEVREVAVLGLPHERWGEEVAAIVRLHDPGALDEKALLEFARSHLAAYKVPSRIFITEQVFPRTATNKVLKAELRELVVGQADAG